MLSSILSYGFGALFAYEHYTMSEEEKAMLKNVEALTNSEVDYVNLCNTYCWNRSGYVCVLETNHGFNINCDEMIAWNTFNRSYFSSITVIKAAI